MEEWKEFTGKTVDDAVAEACRVLNASKEDTEYEVIEKESKGILGIFGKPAKIRARLREKIQPVEEIYTVPANLNPEEAAKDFLSKVFNAMNIDTEVTTKFDEAEQTVNINIIGEDMGVLIGKRGQTLDSLQYLTSLVINKNKEGYLKVKLDTENYRERRKETLENLARNIAYKVKKTHRAVALEPMNPYERRIIHSALQGDKYVETHSEGDEPYRKVVVTLKRNYREYNNRYDGRKYNNRYSGEGNRYNDGRNNRYGYNRYNKYNNNNTRKEYVKHDEDSKDYSVDYKKDYAAYLEQKAAAKAAAENQNNSAE